MLIAHRARRLGLFALPLMLLSCLMIGCPGGSKADLAGKVSYKGKTLSTGSVVLTDAEGKSSSAAIAPDGSFKFVGVPIGKMTVYLDVPEKSGAKGGGGPNLPPGVAGKVKFGPPPGSEGAEKMNMNPKEMNKGNTDPEIPSKYKKPETSGLSVELKSGKNPDYNIDLTD